jgi:membrane associated rhomboid family serine protease
LKYFSRIREEFGIDVKFKSWTITHILLLLIIIGSLLYFLPDTGAAIGGMILGIAYWVYAVIYPEDN